MADRVRRLFDVLAGPGTQTIAMVAIAILLILRITLKG